MFNRTSDLLLINIPFEEFFIVAWIHSARFIYENCIQNSFTYQKVDLNSQRMFDTSLTLSPSLCQKKTCGSFRFYSLHFPLTKLLVSLGWNARKMSFSEILFDAEEINMFATWFFSRIFFRDDFEWQDRHKKQTVCYIDFLFVR